MAFSRGKLLAQFLIFIVPFFAMASDDGGYKKLEPTCDHLLSGSLKVMGSGRDQNELPDFKEAAIHLTELAKSLGMATPPHQMLVVPAPQMNLLASLGRHSAPHWYDGFMILQNLKSSGNILEFVTKGCSVCRSYYSDLNTPNAQVSIIMHVLGHNDVSAHSNYMGAVKQDPMSMSAAFAEKVQYLYDHYDHDEVSLFVQWLYSTEYMQDLAMGTFDHPDYFAPNSSSELVRIEHLRDPKKDSVYPTERRPKRNSPNLLQALTQGIPPGAPAWKRELIEIFEKSRRFISGNVATKIMNEGWATMSQYLLARHSKYVSDQHLIDFGSLLSGVAYPDLKNPYFLGLEAWWHLWEKFKRRPEITALSPFEQDKKFIAFAHEILRTHDDYEFIEKALDQAWVNKNNLILYRKLNNHDKEFAKVSDPWAGYNLALSRDARRVVRYIQRLVSARHLLYPRVLITDFNWHRQGMVHLKHEMFEGVPLKFDSAMRTLFVLAQIFERPVVLEAQFGQGRGAASPPIEVMVEPNGKANFKLLDGTAQEIAAGQKIIDAFKETLRKVVNKDFERSRLDDTWKIAFSAAMDGILAPIQKTMLYAPYADSAVVEYNNLVEKLVMDAALQMIKTGQQPKTANGKVLFRVLPDIPMFELDSSVRMAKIASLAPAPVDSGIYSPAGLGNIGQDDASSLGQGPQLPGDVFKGKPQGEAKAKGKGEGKGEKSDDDDDGDDPDESDEDGDSPGWSPDQPSEPGSGGAGDVAMPMEFWGKLLQAELELPNLRRTDGESTETERIRRGTARRPRGYELDEMTIMNAMEKAMAIRKGRGLPFKIGPDLDRTTLMREALLYLDKGDVVVSDHMNIPIPDFKAVLVVAGDLTGSMAGQRVEMAKQLIYNIKSLLRAQYKEIEIRYVGFSDTAKEFAEDKFFKSFFGGGTSYVSGLKLTKEILDSYANSEWNKFVLLVGDAESGDQVESIQLVQKMSPDLQFFSFAVTTGSYGSFSGNSYVEAFQKYKSTWPYLGIAELRTPNDVILSLKKLYPKGTNEKK